QGVRHPRHLHPSPTRRSSDLTDARKIMKRVAEATHGRGMIIILSDLLTDREPLLKGLEMLRARRHDVMVFKRSERMMIMPRPCRSEEHTSELQSLTNLVCRLL